MSCKWYSFTLSPWRSHFCCLSLASVSYIINWKGVGDARHTLCQKFNLQSGGSTCFNPSENPAHIAGLLWLLFCSISTALDSTLLKEKVSDYNILYYSQIRVGRGKLGKFRQNMNIQLFIRLTWCLFGNFLSFWKSFSCIVFSNYLEVQEICLEYFKALKY